ncbi:MAG: hypothetical protein AUH30_07455 [Candidatus Rokubacteria bacterium 13_1_40CM_68_15]|nr:MAG: hypothetical protein AUH30_07455 [Candidatus Rokubacteria bacterium 13_1_40CM_68_15]
MRVLVLSSVFPNPRQPNLGVFVRERVRRMARSCEAVVVAPVPWFPWDQAIRGRRWGGIPRIERQDGLVVHHPRFVSVPRYGKWLDGILYAASLLGFVRRLRQSFPFEMIDAHFAYPDGMAGVLLGKALGCPVMITLRGSIVRLRTYPLHRPQLRFALQAADRVVAVSESLKRVAIDLGIRAEKIRVIPNGVDTTRFFPMDRDDARRRLGLPLDATILLTVGGVYEGKGQHVVLQALPRLLARDPRLLYVVVGGERVGDSYRHTLDGIIRAHGLGDHVLFVGSKPHEDLRVWYAAADVLCLATRSEGRANVLLESIACGVPVVTTHVGGNPEIVRDGRDGFLVPFGDVESLAAAVDRALHQSWDRGDLVAHARRQSWETTARGVLEECSALRRSTPDIDELSTPTAVSGSGHGH